MRSPTAVAFWAAGAICMPGAIDDWEGEGSPAAGRAEWLAVQPQVPSTRVPATIHARIWPERGARVPLVPLVRFPIEVAVTVILPGHWLTARRRNSRPSQTAVFSPTSR
jgi:hypothetical protein